MTDGQRFEAWVDRTETAEDDLSAFGPHALAAALGSPLRCAALPPLWHWLYFLPVSPLAEAGADGLPRRGEFLPPIDLPRRMWAGGRLSFAAPLALGERARRTSTITAIEDKTGRSGRLVFVTVRHTIEVGGAPRLDEEQDFVYRAAPAPGETGPAPVRAPDGALWRRTVEADPVLLFRYSALTFNSHRIHYDAPYVTQEEGYPALVVHGPLLATLLADLVGRECPTRRLAEFSYRAVRPTFAGQPFTLCGIPSADGSQVELWAQDHEGWLTMQATAALD
jgi:3-methylfumaryl-CoA hydratase